MNGQILFITDGSPAAIAAGENALALAKSQNLVIKAVFIIDEGWHHLLGDEWLNTSATRMSFLNWFNSRLNETAREVLAKFCKQAETYKITAELEIKVGKTEKVITKLASQPETALLVLPNPYSTAPAAEGGLKFNLNAITKKVNCPILIGPMKKA
ncbi:hypothetical protein Desca_1385 [Desulfotomaculum nigrificans CO-1-SRB]|uniref:UspA domain-containing protein n=1 Tax=Desulfotomaculum nigrificans (strain DSM 14880 / VKM B-2319 / CO-1-SRB) TaxID=868595 RepID=F6B5C1_DESCC|nr:universal stress protein [Desulfotomaculum nigrificans]AEF94242.1 hypothetical protein Desca_1385 [Desulfotomaculum nigrificans CO-1-SRB]